MGLLHFCGGFGSFLREKVEEDEEEGGSVCQSGVLKCLREKRDEEGR